MNFWITGYLPDDADDPFIKYELDVSAEFESELLTLLGHENIDETALGMWPLSRQQVEQLALVIKQSLPLDLELFISVVE